MATEARETAGLIGSDKVEGTYVYDAHGQHIGSIERVMIDKRSGQVAYAVLSFGGFLGIGSDYYPIPWDSLKYDTSLGGTAPPSPSSSSKGRRSTRARIGTGTIVSAAARSTIITARRGENTERERFIHGVGKLGKEGVHLLWRQGTGEWTTHARKIARFHRIAKDLLVLQEEIKKVFQGI